LRSCNPSTDRFFCDKVGFIHFIREASQMDNFTIAVLITAVPFVLFLIYGLWSGKLRPDNEHLRGGGEAPKQSG